MGITGYSLLPLLLLSTQNARNLGAFSLRICQGWWEASLLTSHGHLWLTDRMGMPSKEVFLASSQRSYNAADFNFALYRIKELKPAAYEWLLKIPAELWSRHAFDHRLKNDHVTNNLSKSFNHWVGEHRSKPILTLVDGLMAKLMCRLQKRKMKGIKWSGILVPNAVKELNNIKEEPRRCHLLVAGKHEFEVQEY
ncbi:UNVERIFIED_CONTAM: hypothetical protein Slati_2914100 [Sesamum latifolium]|uniref:Uncharacterized protein n=1 Tax=Sesamum latifolium TaxID=2727402 RepID=A0AAW2VDV4_9LAMI